MPLPVTSRPLGPRDESILRAYWAPEPHAHIFAIPDLEHLGWKNPQLKFTGWFNGQSLVGYLMTYGISAQWHYTDERVAPLIATMLWRSESSIRFVTGMEATTWPVLRALPVDPVLRYEASIVARLPAERFDPDTTRLRRGEARKATLADLDPLTATHVAAPDQFNRLSYGERRGTLRSALTDGWRRVYVVVIPDGSIVAAAQTTAEGKSMAVIGGVVTHPAYRGHGYATAATASLCAALLEEKREPYLFYRRDNAPAERVYEKIGFVPMGNAVLAELNGKL